MDSSILIRVSCFSIGLVGILCADLIGQTTPSTEKVTSRFVMKIRMDDQRIAMLKENGSLRTIVPKAFRNTIDGIKMHRDFSFITDELKADDHVEKRGSTLFIKLSDEMLDRLDYQPLLNKVYFSNFNDVLLVYVKPKMRSSKSQAEQSVAESRKFFAKIDEYRGIFGSIDRERIQMKTSFGSVEIDVAKIEGIRFHGGQSISVWLSRQDRISGTIDFDSIKMQCSWGEQVINIDDLETLTLKRDTQLPNFGLSKEPEADSKTETPATDAERSSEDEGLPSKSILTNTK